MKLSKVMDTFMQGNKFLYIMIALVIFLVAMFLMKRKEGFETEKEKEKEKDKDKDKDKKADSTSDDIKKDKQKEQMKILLKQSQYAVSLIRELNPMDQIYQGIITDTSTSDFMKLDKINQELNK
jgi:large-conductance mechanosensitive channel